MASSSDARILSCTAGICRGEDEMIEIVPNLRVDQLNFISGDVGPFRPQVPLWLAVALKKRAKCTIQAPEYPDIVQL